MKVFQGKHGDRVTVTIGGEDITDAKISISKGGDIYVCHNDKNFNGAGAEDKLGYEYSWGFWLSRE